MAGTSDGDHADGCTLAVVAQELGLTRERVRQIEKRALQKLRIALEERGIDETAVREHLADLVNDHDFAEMDEMA